MLLAIIIIVIAAVFMADCFGTGEPVFVEEKSDNFVNISHFEGKMDNDNIKISPTFETIELNDEAYIKQSSKLYQSEKGTLKLVHHPYCYITNVVMKPGQVTKSHNIPRKIWQTMKEPPREGTTVYSATSTFKAQGGWEYTFVSDDDGKKFLAEHFLPDVLHAFETLVPGAYKADLLRVCLLYIHGGVYADAKLFLHYNLDSFLDRDLVLVREFGVFMDKGIWNGFIASMPGNEYFRKVIDGIVENVKNMNYTFSSIGITGPLLYGKVFLEHFKIDHIKVSTTTNYRILNGFKHNRTSKQVINEYDNQEMMISWDKDRSYRKEYNNKDYSQLWRKRKVFDLELHKRYFN